MNNLPVELRRNGRFCVYREEPNGNKKPRKVPFNPNRPSQHAATDRPDTWSSFDAALKAMKKYQFDGINAVCSLEFTFVDLDGCVSDGRISEEAYKIIARLPETYWETSPSGTGLHGIFHCDGEFPALKAGNVEAYCGKHFMSVTGDGVNGVKKIAKAKVADFERLRPVKPAVATPDTSDKLSKLLAGDFSGAGFPSASEADASLCKTLALKGFGRDTVERIWTASGLNRDKMERDDYRQKVLDFAFSNVKQNEAYSGDGSDWATAFPAASEFDGDEFPERHLIKDLIGYQQVVAIPGAPESRKTLGVLEMMRAILAKDDKNTSKAFGHFEVKEKVEGVIYYIPEMSRAAFLKFARFFKLNQFGERFRYRSAKEGATLPLDDPRLQQAVRGRVLVLDTLLYFSGAEDSYKATEWLWFSQQCRRLIEEFDCRAIILLHHPTKAGANASDMDIMQFISQSIALAGLIDTCFGFRRMPDNDYDTVVKCLKAREWENRTKPFVITSHDEKGASYISRGQFPCTQLPGTVDVKEALKSKSGPKPDPEKEKWLPKALEYKAQGMSHEAISKQLKKDGFKKVSKASVQRVVGGDSKPRKF